MHKERFFGLVKIALNSCGFAGEVHVRFGDGEHEAEAIGWVGKPSAKDMNCEIRFSPLPGASDPPRREH